MTSMDINHNSKFVDLNDGQVNPQRSCFAEKAIYKFIVARFPHLFTTDSSWGGYDFDSRWIIWDNGKVEIWIFPRNDHHEYHYTTHILEIIGTLIPNP